VHHRAAGWVEVGAGLLTPVAWSGHLQWTDHTCALFPTVRVGTQSISSDTSYRVCT
jgi:hypothetical protein